MRVKAIMRVNNNNIQDSTLSKLFISFKTKKHNFLKLTPTILNSLYHAPPHSMIMAKNVDPLPLLLKSPTIWNLRVL